MKRRGTVGDFSYRSGPDDWHEQSSSFRPSHRRSRTLSQFSVSSKSSKLTFDQSTIHPTCTLWSYNASGSFSPTTSANASLLALDAGFSREWPYLGYVRQKPIAVSLWDRDEAESPTPQSPEPSSPDSPTSPLSMESSHSSIPSISRTSSSFFDLDSSVTSASGARVNASPPKAEGRYNKMHPILAACEKMSKLSNKAVCATCMKPGYDYPRCAKCGEMWCSRVCRLRGGAKRHFCSRTRI